MQRGIKDFFTIFITVFLAASLALVVASAIGVVAGGWLSAHISEKQLSMIASIGFIVIGLWTLLR